MATIFRQPLAGSRPPIRPNTVDRGFVNAAEVHLLGKDQFFGAPGQAPVYDWPNPRGKPFPQDLRGFINPAAIHLLGKDQFFAAAGQSPRYDWPNPVARRASVAAAAVPVNLLPLTSAGGGGATVFSPYYWLLAGRGAAA